MGIKQDYAAQDTLPAADLNDIVATTHGLGAYPQATPDMTVAIRKGSANILGTIVSYAGGNSPTATAPTTNPRIDLITIDQAGTVAAVTGTEAASPAVPTYPVGKLVICEIYHRTGSTQILQNDDSTNSYIQRNALPIAVVQRPIEVQSITPSNTAITSAADIANSELTFVTDVECDFVCFGYGAINGNTATGRDVRLWVREDIAGGGYADMSGADGYCTTEEAGRSSQVTVIGHNDAVAAGTHKFKLRGQELNGGRTCQLDDVRFRVMAIPNGNA